MALWSARNGYMGYGPVAALVEADTEAEARVLASAALGDRDAREDYGHIESIVQVKLPYTGDTLP